MALNQHYLHSNPIISSERYINFAEKKSLGKKFQFSFPFFLFNILWLLQKKLFGLIPLWIFMTLSSLNLYYFFLDNRSPFENEFLLIIIIAPHVLFSCFIYNIQYIYTDNIIWKHRDNIEHVIKRLTPYNLIGFIVFSTICMGILLNYFIMLTTSHMQEKNQTKAFFELVERNSPENRAKIEEALKMMESTKQR